MGSYNYTAQDASCPEGALASRPHAVTSTVGATTTLYCYDRNGNMTRRDPSGTAVYNFQYDAEGRLTTVSGSATASFVFDGDGNRVKSTVGGVTTVHIGAYFEWTGSTSTMKKYSSAGGVRVAMRTGASTLYFILRDHPSLCSGDTPSLCSGDTPSLCSGDTPSLCSGDTLGSTSVTTDSNGALLTDNRYKAWGEARFASGTLPTRFTYTGQYSYVADFGLMYYGARWYDSALSRFAQADSVIPRPGDPLAWDRYAYVLNNALKYIDPTGHMSSSAIHDSDGDAQCNDLYRCLDKHGILKLLLKTVTQPFYDPEADSYGSVTVEFSVGDPKYEPIDPFGEAQPTSNRMDQLFRWMNLGLISLKDYFNSSSLSGVKPNAQITVYYNAYSAINPSHDFGIEVSGMWVVNNSETTLILENASMYGNSNDKTLIYLNSQTVPAGEMTSINLHGPNFQTLKVSTFIYMKTLSGTPVIVPVILYPFGYME